ncbi:MAG: hypothetical protein U5L10_01510 [Candidatus Moranbacteria bacterium]|nr:hypothetical protein [Candidatus Moranbacteria bacterium]
MSINIIFIAYWIILFLVFVMAGIIVYHLLAYSLNKKITFWTVAIFLGVLLVLVVISLMLIFSVNLNDYIIYF